MQISNTNNIFSSDTNWTNSEEFRLTLIALTNLKREKWKMKNTKSNWQFTNEKWDMHREREEVSTNRLVWDFKFSPGAKFQIEISNFPSCDDVAKIVTCTLSDMRGHSNFHFIAALAALCSTLLTLTDWLTQTHLFGFV